MLSVQRDWFNYASALTPSVVALAVGYIAYRQWGGGLTHSQPILGASRATHSEGETMKRVALIALIGSVPLGALVGVLAKLDAKDYGWSKRGWPVFVLAGAVLCAVGAVALTFALGGLTGVDT